MHIKNESSVRPVTTVYAQMEPKPRLINVDIHVLAYLGDYLKAFKALVKGKVAILSSQPPQVR
jgi:hypothetical protein